MICYEPYNYLTIGSGSGLWRGPWLDFTPVASVTRDVRFPVREPRVDIGHHAKHHARDFFFRIGIAGKIACDVTIRAGLAKIRTRRAHERLHLLRLENLQILWRGREWIRTLRLSKSRRTDKERERQ